MKLKIESNNSVYSVFNTDDCCNMIRIDRMYTDCQEASYSGLEICIGSRKNVDDLLSILKDAEQNKHKVFELTDRNGLTPFKLFDYDIEPLTMFLNMMDV
jgi:hypothetical protein